MSLIDTPGEASTRVVVRLGMLDLCFMRNCAGQLFFHA